MSKCPLCYNNIDDNKCGSCDIELTDGEMLKLKAATYDSIINHLHKSMSDDRRREKARIKIALRNIKGWAKENRVK